MTIDWKKHFQDHGIPTDRSWLRSLGNAWDDGNGDTSLSGKWAVLLVAAWSQQDRQQLFDAAQQMADSGGKSNLAFQFFDDHQEVQKRWPGSRLAKSDCFTTPLWLLVEDGKIVNEKFGPMTFEAFEQWYHSRYVPPAKSIAWELWIGLFLLCGLVLLGIGSFFSIPALEFVGGMMWGIPLLVMILAAVTILGIDRFRSQYSKQFHENNKLGQ